jgi:hypothetical protein
VNSCRGVSALWAILAAGVLVVTFGAGWWWSVGAAAAAILVGSRNRSAIILSALYGLASAILWLYLLPQTTGSELILVGLAALSVCAGLASADLARSSDAAVSDRSVT